MIYTRNKYIDNLLNDEYPSIGGGSKFAAADCHTRLSAASSGRLLATCI
jgi:hypothetical protein